MSTKRILVEYNKKKVWVHNPQIVSAQNKEPYIIGMMCEEGKDCIPMWFPISSVIKDEDKMVEKYLAKNGVDKEKLKEQIRYAIQVAYDEYLSQRELYEEMLVYIDEIIEAYEKFVEILVNEAKVIYTSLEAVDHYGSGDISLFCLARIKCDEYLKFGDIENRLYRTWWETLPEHIKKLINFDIMC